MSAREGVATTMSGRSASCSLHRQVEAPSLVVPLHLLASARRLALAALGLVILVPSYCDGCFAVLVRTALGDDGDGDLAVHRDIIALFVWEETDGGVQARRGEVVPSAEVVLEVFVWDGAGSS